ncbi:MAG: CPBP family intramembrane metalloprotease [Clostridiales bacterium]|jgi:membrane protease YdiL (CAAX protease family)|nr:CPBP family intramembrane metalloprotease [Clostridiales bacterium]
MYNPPYYPFYNPDMYDMARNAKHELRKTSNSLCWTLLAAVFLIAGVTAGGTFYLQAVGFQGDYSFGSDFNGFTPLLYYLLTDMGYVVGLAVPALIYFAAKRIPLSEALPFQKTGVLRMLAFAALGVAVCLLANIPANIVANMEKAFGFSGDLPQMPLTDDPAVLALYGVTIAVIPPIVEELLFRGMVLNGLRKFGNTFAVFGSALLFGLYHGNLIQMVFAFIAGLVMAFAVIRTGSLWTSILIHCVNNSISFAVEMTQRYAGAEAAGRLDTIVMTAVIALGILSLIYLLIREKHLFRGEPHNPLLPVSARVGAMLWNPGGVAMLLYFFISSAIVLTQY